MLDNKRIPKEEFYKMIELGEIGDEGIGFHTYKKTNNGQYILLHVNTFNKLKEKGYNFSIILKFTSDGYLAPTILNHRVRLYLSSKKSSYELLQKMNISLRDIHNYYMKK